MSFLEVFVSKQGLLAAAGHDLRLRAPASFEIRRQPPGVSVTVDVASISVDTAMRRGVPDPSALSARDRSDIETSLRERVLDAAHHPRILFRSTHVVEHAARYRVEGLLTIRGVERSIAFDVVRTATEDGERCDASVVVHQPNFGIRPFRALLGALSIEPDVEVRGSAIV